MAGKTNCGARQSQRASGLIVARPFETPLPPMIRRRHHKTQFTIVPNSIFEDDRLSAAAKGTLGYLLSRPPSWEVRHGQLRRVMRLGRRALDRVMCELTDAQYAKKSKEQMRHSDNTFLGYDYDIFDLPQADDDSSPQAADTVASAESRQHKCDSGNKKEDIKELNNNLIAQSFKNDKSCHAAKPKGYQIVYSDMGQAARANGMYAVWEGSKGFKLWLRFRGPDGMPPFDAASIDGQLRRIVWLPSLYPPSCSAVDRGGAV